MININDIHKQFKLPICYLENTKETPAIVSRDLELKEYTEILNLVKIYFNNGVNIILQILTI